MTLPLTDLKFSQINSEMGRASTAVLNMDDAEGRKLAAAGNTGQDQASKTSIMASKFRGHARNKFYVASDRKNVNMYDDVSASNYAAGKTYVTYTVNAGIKVGSANTGSPGMVIAGFNSGDLVELVNNGTIQGCGGAGGVGNFGSIIFNGVIGGTGGSPGGPAMQVSCAITITNTGGIWGGGGGGGAGDGASNFGGIFNPEYRPIAYGGSGGGGAGYDPGAGGGGGYPASPGTSSAGGAGSSGYSAGGPGGGPGLDGTTVNGYWPAGSAGAAISGKSYINGGAGASGDVRGSQT